MRIRERFNPRAPCGARRFALEIVIDGNGISTHAPLAGRDGLKKPFAYEIIISTHAPLAGRDSSPAALCRARWNFNPRAPCGARRRCCWT